MSILTATKNLGRFLAFVVVVLIVAPVLYFFISSSPVAGAFNASGGLVKSLMIPLLILRFSIYSVVYLFYEPITRHFTKKLEFDEADVDYALNQKTKMILWVILFEIFITWSLITLMG